MIASSCVSLAQEEQQQEELRLHCHYSHLDYYRQVKDQLDLELRSQPLWSSLTP